MHIRKSILSCLLILSIVFSMLWYFSINEDAGEVISEADKTVTITIWYTDESLTDYLNSAAFAYYDKYGVRVVPELHSGVEYLEQIYDMSVEGSDIPDLYIAGTDMIEKAAMSGLAIPVPDTRNSIGLMTYPEVAINSITYQNEKFGYPFYFETSFLLYNWSYLKHMADATLRDELGLDIVAVSDNSVSENETDDSEGSNDSDTNKETAADDEGKEGLEVSLESDMSAPEGYTQEEWDALIDKKVQEMIPASIQDILDFSSKYSTPEKVENIFLWDVSDIFYNYFFAGYYMNIGGVYGDDPSIVDIYNEDTVACLTIYQGLNDYFSIDSETSSYAQVLQGFIDGKTIFMIATTDALTAINNAQYNGTFSYDYSVAPLPGVDEQHQAKGLSVTNAVLINGYTNYREEADGFAEFISNEYADSFFTRTGKLPVSSSAQDYITDSTDLARDMYKQSAALPNLFKLSDFWVELENTYTLIWDGADPAEKLEELENQIKSTLE